MSDQLLTLVQNNAVIIGIVAVVGVWFFVLRTRATNFASNDEFAAMIGSGQPVVLEFFSNL